MLQVTPEQQTAYETTMAAVGSKATYTGASTTVFAWMLSSEFGILLGIMLGLGGFIVNWYYKHKQDKREEVEHARRMGMYD
jgi:hypothetical protein